MSAKFTVPFLTAFSHDLDDGKPVDLHTYCRSIQANLNTLLNTRSRVFSVPSTHVRAQASMLDFGILDFSAVNMMSEAGRRSLAEAMQTAIRHYEPRLHNLCVTFVPGTPEDELKLHFRIEACVICSGNSETVRWDSVIEPVSRHIRLSEAMHG